MPFFRNQRQYQQLAYVAVVVAPVVTAVCNTTLSSEVIFKGQFQYQSHTEPAFVPPEIITVDKWIYGWSEPVRVKIDPKLAVALSQNANINIVQPKPVPLTTYTSPVFFKIPFQYPSYFYTPFTIETITEDKWHYSWSEPVRQKPGLRASLQQAAIGPVLDDETQIIQTYESRWHQAWSEPVRFRRFPTSEQQAQVQGSVYPFEIITCDKWLYPWTEPVRQKIGLKAHLQQAFIAPVLDDETQIIQDFESRWHFPWSEPVRFRRYPTSEQPFFTIDPKTPEFVTSDKWAYSWSEPVRFRRFPTSEQQSYAAPTYTPEFITTDKWIYPWSEPVRQKIGLKTYLQQAAIGPVLNPDTQISQNYESRWHYAWSEPVRIKPQVPAGEQSFLIQGPVRTPEFITVDKWIYGWSEPVRQKIWLKTHLQQAYIAPVLNPETQIIHGYESRWHFPWSEPVRVKRPLLTAQQQSVAYQSAFFETINIDKWGFAWSEPVRQKIGLKSSLQQAFIGLTLNPETQIIQGYESRWHFAWSEPVRVKPALRAGLQQAQVQGPVRAPEFITVDKWIYPWTDPVRQKIGIRAALQQAFIAPVLADDQLTGTIESRWHQPWSEPLRSRRLATAEQQSIAAPATSIFETITLDKWFRPFNEPVKQKIWLRASLQQAFIAPVLNPETQIIQGYESRWHQPWSEPTRRKASVASHPTFTWSAFTPAVAPSEDCWHQSWSEPVRLKIGLKHYLQQDIFSPVVPGPTFVPSFSSPVIFPDTIQYVSQVWPLPIPDTRIESMWHQPWSEPSVKEKRGLRSDLQQAFTASPVFPNLVRTINWFSPFNEPVRLKIGLGSFLQRTFTAGTDPIANPFQVTLSATETNADSALFGITVYNAVPVVARIPTVVVSIKEIQAIRVADVSIEEDQAIDNASVSVKET